jgi:hypothetical protein
MAYCKNWQKFVSGLTAVTNYLMFWFSGKCRCVDYQLGNILVTEVEIGQQYCQLNSRVDCSQVKGNALR